MAAQRRTDDHDLEGLDPYELLDQESARIDAYLSSIDDRSWEQPSRCAGWRVRDVAAHLASTERYHQACLDGKVSELIQRMMSEGVQSLEDANERGVRAFDGVLPRDVLAQWRSDDAETRRGFRDHDGGMIDSSVGEYPARWQAFHVASELATHADDMYVPVTDDEKQNRLGWRVRFSRFALREAKAGLEASEASGGTRVVLADGDELVLDDTTFVETVAGRLPDGSPVAPETRAALSTMP